MITTDYKMLENMYLALMDGTRRVTPVLEIRQNMESRTYFKKAYYFEQNDKDCSFLGELNIHKVIDKSVAYKSRNLSEHLSNHLGQECLKAYNEKIMYNGKDYYVYIVEFFGSHANKGFSCRCVALPPELIAVYHKEIWDIEVDKKAEEAKYEKKEKEITVTLQRRSNEPIFLFGIDGGGASRAFYHSNKDYSWDKFNLTYNYNREDSTLLIKNQDGAIILMEKAYLPPPSSAWDRTEKDFKIKI